MASVYFCSRDKMSFTEGMSVDQAHLLSGSPVELLKEGADFGKGFCPNCGKDCKDTKENYEASPAGKDPFQPIHDEIASAVADPDHPLTADGAQAALLEAVGNKGGDN